MNATARREAILQKLAASREPVSASALAGQLGVSRQIVVGDVALLRAGGARIDATPRGYLLGEAAAGYIRRFPVEHCFEAPALHVLEDAVREQGAKVCFMAEYFLPDLGALRPLDSPYPLKMLGPADFGPLYTGTWSNALCKDRRELDVLGIGAYDGGELAGFAACSADCEGMWQIGVDVLPAYRRQGIASALTSRLALAILERDKVPFYCAAWSNLRSVRNALRCGFRPAWVELNVRSTAFVERMNGAQ